MVVYLRVFRCLLGGFFQQGNPPRQITLLHAHPAQTVCYGGILVIQRMGLAQKLFGFGQVFMLFDHAVAQKIE